MQTKIKLGGKNASDVRKALTFYYQEKFFNKFVDKFKIKEGLTYQQFHYLLKKFYWEGTISACKIPFTETENRPEGEIVFAPWVVGGLYNIYDFPITARMINTRGVSFIPTKEMKVDEEIVIGWIQPNHKSVYSSIEAKVKQLVDIEMTMRTNMKSSKTPLLFGISPENIATMKELADNLENDEPNIFLPIEAVEKAKAFQSGGGFLVDKLEPQRQKVENDILTILGVNNVGIAEKKEHLIVDEVNANNQQIQESGDSYMDYMNAFFERIKNVLGHTIVIEMKNVSSYEEMSDNIDKEDNHDEED